MIASWLCCCRRRRRCRRRRCRRRLVPTAKQFSRTPRWWALVCLCVYYFFFVRFSLLFSSLDSFLFRCRRPRPLTNSDSDAWRELLFWPAHNKSDTFMHIYVCATGATVCVCCADCIDYSVCCCCCARVVCIFTSHRCIYLVSKIAATTSICPSGSVYFFFMLFKFSPLGFSLSICLSLYLFSTSTPQWRYANIEKNWNAFNKSVNALYETNSIDLCCCFVVDLTFWLYI